MASDINNQNAIDVLKDNAKTFSFASFFLGRQRTREAARLYRFCRTVDDIADHCDNKKVARQKLQSIQTDLQSGNSHSDDPVVSDFIDLCQTKSLDTDVALDLIDGVISDLDHVRIQNIKELDLYCYKVAGTVGLLMCPILGTTDNNAKKFGRDLGKAMQITNICRDIREDAENNRIYIPQDMISTDLTSNLSDPDEQVQKACKSLLENADKLYNRAEYGIAYLPLGSKLCILVASRLYRAIGHKLLKKDCAYWKGRVYTTPIEKVSISLMAVLSLLCSTKYWVRKRYDQT